MNIKGLFGRFDYSLTFDPKGIAIITGPNGFGKSTILRMLYNVSNGNVGEVLKTPFKSVLFTGEKASLLIVQGENEFSINDIALPYPNEKEAPRNERRFRVPPYYRKMDDGNYLNVRTDEIVNFDVVSEAIRRYGFYTNDFFFYDIIDDFFSSTSEKDAFINITKKVVESVDLLKSSLGKITYIREQRLIEEHFTPRRFGEETPSISKTINDCSSDLKKRIEAALNSHSVISNDLDSTYLNRLIKCHQKISYDDYQKSYEKLKENQTLLNRYGFSKNDSSFLGELEKGDVTKFGIALSIYFDDCFKKFEVLNPLLSKVRLFEELINNKLMYKRLIVDKGRGLVVVDNKGDELPLTSLSSGEQEIIVLFYKLLFESEANLFLIDEPEISLHIAWQRELLSDFKRIQKTGAPFGIIIATHSPDIIANNWDLQIDLAEQSND